MEDNSTNLGPDPKDSTNTMPVDTTKADAEVVDSLALDEKTTEDSQESSELDNSVAGVVEPVVLSVPAKKSKKKLLLVIALVVLLLIGGVVGWFVLLKDDSTSDKVTEQNQVSETPKLGVAASLVEGLVEYSSDKGTTWQKLSADIDLKEGDQVRTLADGRAVLLIDDGSAARLANNSTAELTMLDVTNTVITNISGEIYTRVTASTTRVFTVSSADKEYTAKGTAYRTTNTAVKKGVEVFHSTVGVDKTTDVTEGNAFYTLSEQKEKENVVSAIDLTSLKKDEFIKWNSEQDKKEAEFANSLGVLVELDKPDPTPPPVVAPPASVKSAITLSSSVSEYSANFSWKVTGVDVSQGFKLVKSKTSQTPTYPDNTAAYVEAGKTSYSLYLGDGKTYYFRICAYRGSSCESYSNTVTVTTPLKEVEKPTSGPVTLSITGSVASWTYDGTAPHGFKLVISQAPGVPSYGSALKTNFTGSPHEINYLDPGTYNVRVCKYTASDYEGGCMNYSNQVTHIVP